MFGLSLTQYYENLLECEDKHLAIMSYPSDDTIKLIRIAVDDKILWFTVNFNNKGKATGCHQIH
jgi:hypothetical protein